MIGQLIGTLNIKSDSRRWRYRSVNKTYCISLKYGNYNSYSWKKNLKKK